MPASFKNNKLTATGFKKVGIKYLYSYQSKLERA